MKIVFCGGIFDGGEIKILWAGVEIEFKNADMQFHH